MVNCQIMPFAGTALPMMAASLSWWESLPGRTFGPIFRSNCGLWSVSMLSQVLSNRVSFACFVVSFRCHWPTRWTVWAFLTLLFNLYDLHFGSIKGAYHSGVHWHWHLGISMTDVAFRQFATAHLYRPVAQFSFDFLFDLQKFPMEIVCTWNTIDSRSIWF